MSLPILDISLNFSSGATFGNPFILNSSTLDGTDVLSDATNPSLILDLTDSTRSISISRGRNIGRDTYEAGTCSVRIYDPTGQFNPQNTSSALFGFLTPKEIRQLLVQG